MAAATERGFFASDGRLADALPDGIVVVDSAGVIVSANRRLAEMTGYADESLVGQSVDLLVPEDRRRSHSGQRANFSAHPAVRPMGVELDIVCRRSDGSLFPADIALSPIHVSGTTYVVAAVRDVTQGRALADARREAEERFRLLVESASGLAIFMLDVEGRVSSWNLGAQRLKGYERDEIIGQPFSVFYTSADRDLGKPEQLLTDAAATGRAEDFGWRVRKDGSRFQAGVSITASKDGNGRLRGFTKIVRDNSAALQARDAVERLHLLEQREHLGRDLHDGVIQSLFAVGMSLQALLPRVDDTIVADGLQQSVRALDDSITELRTFILGLSTHVTPARVRRELERLAAETRARSGIEVTGVINPAALAALGNRARDVLLVAREAMSNVERHSGASSCVLSLGQTAGDAVELIVQDDGDGFDPSQPGEGLGLNNARSRAGDMGALYSVDSSPAGTRVTLLVPVTE
jgi:PAS domain S-box-containing protein